MEDIFKFLLVAGIIVVGIIKQFRKEAQSTEAPPSDEHGMAPTPRSQSASRKLGRRNLWRIHSRRSQTSRTAPYPEKATEDFQTRTFHSAKRTADIIAPD